MTERQIDLRERELDYWMARAYEAEGKLWKADARIRHLEATAQVLVKEVLDAENARDESQRGKAEAEARIKAVEDALDWHPDPRCDQYPDGDPIACGWKHAYADIRHAMEG